MNHIHSVLALFFYAFFVVECLLILRPFENNFSVLFVPRGVLFRIVASRSCHIFFIRT